MVVQQEEKKEYWRWPEADWVSPDIDWKKGGAVSCGVDVGSVSTQVVVMVDGKLYGFSNHRTGSQSADSADRTLKQLLDKTDLTLKDIHYTVGTGYGRVNVPFAQRTITEIACHALGANFIYGPSVRTILDVGGQDCKAIRCDEKGKVLNFLMNDKCAAGTGRGMEVIANLLSVPIQDVGERSFQIDKEPKPVSSTCVVFAKTEATGLLTKGYTINEILAAYCAAMAHRIVELLKRLGVEKEFAITGGQSKNIGTTRRIEQELGIKALPWSEVDPQLAGGIGAALFARAIVEKARK
ncbi:MAG: benzoyl-CoA reductase, bzd-type, subunit Q [Chloroflexi bacterium]|nr:benzoyl-CoA reductase, bzd-type, subunit Q [Chloroflexota bacterium]